LKKSLAEVKAAPSEAEPPGGDIEAELEEA
jgi:hypothetical protein